ncbi:MAG TPA: hypothetical protein VGC47_08865 [Acidimicrobiia bacterium]
MVGSRYRIEGFRHEVLVPAALPGEGLARAFPGKERGPSTPGQLRVTLLRDGAIEGSVTRVA